MANKDTKTNFETWVAKATQRLEAKRTPRHQRLYIPSLDDVITVRSLTSSEIAEIVDNDTEDSIRQDKRLVYTAVVEPDLHVLAKQLQEVGQIVDPLDVTEMLTQHERAEIVLQVMDLSGVTGDSISVVDSEKN